jgi:hypothetical protein
MSPIPKAPLRGEATIVATTRKRDMTRAETAPYITDHWFPCSPKTLAKLAVTGGGPPFRKAGRVPLYSEASVDTWAESKIGPLVHSTTDQAVNFSKKLIAEKADEAPKKGQQESRVAIGSKRPPRVGGGSRTRLSAAGDTS